MCHGFRGDSCYNHHAVTPYCAQTLNVWNSYGCDNSSGRPVGIDRQFVMCEHNYYNNTWVDDDTVVFTGGRPEDYTTSVMGACAFGCRK